jgi:hypothetical protein
MSRVGYFIDDSGSMTTETVIRSVELFQQRARNEGFIEVYGTSNTAEDYITPCKTTSAILNA